MSKIAERLRTYRALAGLSSYKLAQRAGISSQHLRHIETGRVRQPRAGLLYRIARALNCRMEDLLGEERLK